MHASHETLVKCRQLSPKKQELHKALSQKTNPSSWQGEGKHARAENFVLLISSAITKYEENTLDICEL